MNAKLKKPVLFAVIVVIGSILVLFDIPLILLVPLIIIVVFAALLALGSLTITEIRGAMRFEDLKKIGILRRLDEMKFFEKSAAETKKAPLQAPEKKETKKEVKKHEEEKSGVFTHVSAFFSSIGSLGSVLKARNRQGKKVDDINKLLDKTVSEKVSAPPPAPLKPAAAAGSAPGGAGGGLPAPPAGEDPFMSLSGDEFDEGLLEGLGEDLPMTPAAAPAGKTMDAGSGPEAAAPGPDLPPPTLEISTAAGDILKEAGEGGGLEEFSGLEGGELSDTDFGDLDNLNLDEVSPDADLGEGPDTAAAAPVPAPEAPAQPAPAAVPAADSGAVKTAWIPSDAPKGAVAEDEISTQADMAAFASGPGGDEDLLSSIASDVKRATKEQDLSLLRELKDFRAPASEIQKELGGMYERMNQAQQTKRKKPPDQKE
jgi:hypothetical protein